MNLVLPRTLRGRSAPLIALAFFIGAICPECMAQTNSATLVEKTNASGASENFLKTTGSPIYFMVYSPDESELSVNYRFDDPLVLDTTTWKNLRNLPGLRMMAYAPDSTLMATAEGRDGLRLWERGKKRSIKRLGDRKSLVVYTSFSPDGKILASTNREKGVDIWNPDTGELVQTLKGHTDLVNCLVFSSDGRRLYTADNGFIKTWDMSTWKEIQSIQIPEGAGQIMSMKVSSDNVAMATVHTSIGVMIWNTSSWRARVQRNYFCAAFSSDGNELAMGGKDLLLWDIDLDLDIQSGRTGLTAEVRATITLPELTAKEVFPDDLLKDLVADGVSPDSRAPVNVAALTYSRDGKTLVAGCWDGTIRFLER